MEGDRKREGYMLVVVKISMSLPVNGIEKSSIQLQFALSTEAVEGGNVLLAAFECCQL